METEADLVRRSRTGDREALSRLIELHETVARRVATAMVGSGGEADDVVQEAFVKACTRLDQFREGVPFRPWLLAIVANEARNRHRSSSRRTHLAVRMAARRQDEPFDPAEVAVAHEQRQRLAEAVAALGARDREVVALRYFAGLTEAEMADALGCAPGTVKSRLHRALTRLRTSIAEEVHR